MRIIIALMLLMLCLPVQADTFYGKMKSNLSTRQDLQHHYTFNRRIGAVVRYAPSEYQFVGLVGITTLDFIGKEVFWDLLLRQGKFDMQDAAANFKGLKDGMNGRNELEVNDFKKALNEINAYSRILIEDHTNEISENKKEIEELKKQVEILKALLQ